MSRKQLQTIIILRNDSTTAWATSERILEPGELGVGYIYEDDGTTIKNVIVKAGNGVDAWKNLPQVEGVFEDDVILTYNFGKHTTQNGYVNAGGKGMTTSQWLVDALSVTEDPDVTQPSYTLTASTITTNTGSKEIGSKVTKLAWNGDFKAGSYEFGSVVETDNGDGTVTTTTYTKDQGTGVTATYEMSCSHGDTLSNILDGSVTLATPIVIADDKGTDCGKIFGTCTWGDSPRTPVNNVGAKVNSLTIEGGNSGQQTASFSITGYREGFFYGSSNSEVKVEDVDSVLIRGLSKTGAKYASGNKSYTIPKGAKSIIFAWDANKTGITSILNTTVNAYMDEAFDIGNPHTVSVGGADATAESIGEYAADYKFVIYTPADAYGSTAALTIKLG